MAYIGAYFTDYRRPPGHPEPSSDPVAVVRLALEVLAVSFGIGVLHVWWVVALGLLGVGTATVAILLRRWGDPGERLWVAGVLAVAAGVTGVALAIGVGRGAWGAGMGLWARYTLLTWPLLAMTYLVWARLGGKWVPVALCVAAALVFPPNTGTGMMIGRR